MTSSTKERQARIDGLLDALAEAGGSVARISLASLAVRSYGVSRKVAMEYIEHLVDAEWAAIEVGTSLTITPRGRKHLLAADDWPLAAPRMRTVPTPPSPPTTTEDRL